jgi:hypothetical protein
MPVSALGSRLSGGRTSRVKDFAEAFSYKASSCCAALRCRNATFGSGSRNGFEKITLTTCISKHVAENASKC